MVRPAQWERGRVVPGAGVSHSGGDDVLWSVSWSCPDPHHGLMVMLCAGWD